MIDPDLVSILIVNYRGAKYLQDCLTALAEQSLPRHRFEVIVWDNASDDASREIIETHFSWVKLVHSPLNLGFADGNNRASSFARGTRLILLNNDTIPDPFFLEELVRVWDRTPTARVVAKLVFAAEPRVLHSTGLVKLRDGRGADRGFREVDTGKYERTEEVFAGCGAALGLHRPDLGMTMFEPHYFAYYEDFASGWEHRKAGGSCVYAPRALVRHVHGGAAGEHSELFHFHVERNRALTALRLGSPLLAGYCTAVLFAKTFRTLLNPRRSRRARTLAAACFSYLGWMPRTLLRRWHLA